MSKPQRPGQTLTRRAYWLTRGVKAFAPFVAWLGRVESIALGGRSRLGAVDRPIYICGIPRSGTTITLEMLSRHPDVATHHYRDFNIPYLLHWGPRIVDALRIPQPDRPVERSHRDRIMITSDSPECVEEMLWEHYFDGLHVEHSSNILDGNTDNLRFEAYYRDHLRKLVALRGATRYLTKSNYCILRLQYLMRIFPKSRFLITIRNPVDHVASLLKQDRLFAGLGAKNPRRAEMSRLNGHHHFGSSRAFAHLGDDAHVREKVKLAASGQAAVAWALEWAAVYRHVADVLRTDPALAKACHVVRYEDLCADPEATLAAMLDHAELDSESFAPTVAHYRERVCLPGYYTPDFTGAERAAVVEATRDVAQRFGYGCGQAESSHAPEESLNVHRS